MMKHLALIMLAVLAITAAAIAAVPQRFYYQGSLMRANGIPLDTTISVTLSLYNVPAEGTMLWSETYNNVTVRRGLFAVVMGQGSDLTPSLFQNGETYLGITVGTDPEMTPRARFVSVPYSYQVLTLDGASAGTVSGRLTVTGSVVCDTVIAADGIRFSDGTLQATAASFDTTSLSSRINAKADSADNATRSWVSGQITANAGQQTADTNTYDATRTWVSGRGFLSGADTLSLSGRVNAKADSTDNATRTWVSGQITANAGQQAADTNTYDATRAWVGAQGYLVGVDTLSLSDRINAKADSAGNATRAWVAAQGYLASGQAYADTNTYDATREWVRSNGYLRASTNSATGTGAFVGGGSYNSARGNYSVVVGGGNSTAADSNSATGTRSFVGGGSFNKATNTNATVCGGQFNTASGQLSFVGGAYHGTASGLRAVVCGGGYNSARGDYSVIVGGGGSEEDSNSVTGDNSFIGGGHKNVASADNCVVTGGISNTANTAQATVSGGYGNVAGNYFAAVGGGNHNKARGYCSVIAGGGSYDPPDSNSATGHSSAILGGSRNYSSGDFSSIGGGRYNRARGDYSVTAGGGGTAVTDSNSALGTASTVGGGRSNTAVTAYSTVSGGMGNRAEGTGSVVCGGRSNSTTGNNEFIGGGQSNSASSTYAVITGGYNNDASGSYSSVGGGANNHARGDYSVIGGGGGSLESDSNSATGLRAVVPGGGRNKAAGAYSFAAGLQAKALHNGSFVWASNVSSDFADSADGQFRVRATGGVWMFTSSTNGAKLPASATAWVAISDSTKKTDIRAVDTKSVLEKVANLPIKEWRYKEQPDPSIRHIGPMAQDLWSLFHYGEDSLGISTIDPDGIALAAIQELAKRNEKLEKQNQKLEEEVALLRAQMQSLLTGDKKALLQNP